jgi:uncharacterized iron-regulated membrane protein
MSYQRSRAEPRKGQLYSMFWRWHFLAALIVIPFVLWQSTTGTLYLWSEWWMDYRYPGLRFVAPEGHDAAPSEQIAAALASVTETLGTYARPDETAAWSAHAAHWRQEPSVEEILISDDPHRSTIVLLRNASGLPYPIFVNPHDARVLGSLAAAEWLPGITRSLHGGWPLGKPGSWLLELGDGWAIAMIVTGLYLWWPRSRGFWRALWPRLRAGPRLLIRDLHSCVAVLFSAVFLFFLISALPWTAFWGGEVLSRIQSVLGQTSPAGFSPGGASVAQMTFALASVDEIVDAARARGVTGTLDIRLAPWPNAPLFVVNRDNAPADDRTLLGDPKSGEVTGDFRHADLPVIPRLVSIGVHVHEGDFGPANLWLNTAFAMSLVWLSVTGVLSWWIRRPKRGAGIPPKVLVRWPPPLLLVGGMLCVLLPIFGASIAVVAGADRLSQLGLRRLRST